VDTLGFLRTAFLSAPQNNSLTLPPSFIRRERSSGGLWYLFELYQRAERAMAEITPASRPFVARIEDQNAVRPRFVLIYGTTFIAFTYYTNERTRFYLDAAIAATQRTRSSSAMP
jgi:hypothetical protein